MSNIRINAALISVFNKDGLDHLVKQLHDLGIVIYSTGGTQEYIESLNIPVVAVENITGYPSILGGRVKTLHPKVFGGILAIRNDDHKSQLAHFQIPLIDLVVVDLYPFEDTLKSTNDHDQIIEKIDIGGISLIRAAAKNYKDLVVIPSKNQYDDLAHILKSNGISTIEQRKHLATKAFEVSSHYDQLIGNYLSGNQATKTLRYGENPHQKAWFHGDIEALFESYGQKELSYNNLLDVDAAVQLMKDFKNDKACFAILKHNNVCGFAKRDTILDAWHDALAGDPVSAFGGILISNKTIDIQTAHEIDKLFYEVLIAPSFDQDAVTSLTAKKNRLLLKLKDWPDQKLQKRSLLNGVLEQEADDFVVKKENLNFVTLKTATESQITDLILASTLVKHLKSNAIVLVKNNQLIGMGCGQTSRVDACKQAIYKAKSFGFELTDAAMASEAFFPFPDCVELAAEEKISAIIQPGGSMNDQKSIDASNQYHIAMCLTGIRHFKH